MSDITIKTNSIPRHILDGHEMTDKERKEFDYVDWDTIDTGHDSASFFRYKGHTYDLGEFMTTDPLPEFSPLRKWDGYLNDSFFSGIVIRWCEDHESVIVGTFYA
jgi:hypothetical protein